MAHAPAVLVAWHDRYTEVFSNPSVRPLWTSRMRAFRELLGTTGLLDCCVELVSPRKCGLRELLLVHDEGYVRKLVELSGSRSVVLIDYGDTYAYPGMIDDVLMLVGGTLLMLDELMSGARRVAYQPYGGLHHARRERAAGFCPVNDVAVAVEKARAAGARRVAVVDIDAHHADGTQDIYWDDPDVLLISFHAYFPPYFYPGTGSERELGGGRARGTKLNVPLEPGTGDRAFMHAFTELVPEALEAFGPDVVMAQLGVDGHRSDRLGVLNLTSHTYLRVASLLAKVASRLGVPLLAFGGGGYGPDSAKAMVAEVAGFAEALGLMPADVRERVGSVTAEEPSDDPPERCERLSRLTGRLLAELRRHLA